MDPDAAAKFIIDSLKEGDLPQAGMATEELIEWLKRGGFPPRPELLAELLLALIKEW